MRREPESWLVFESSRENCGWEFIAPGRWHRGREIIFARTPGVWYWYPHGFGGRRRVGPFKTFKGARLRARQGLSVALSRLPTG